MIHYVAGDATDPQGDGPMIIAHICNDTGRWGAGFVKALSARWSKPELEYRRWYERSITNGLARLPLGHIQRVCVDKFNQLYVVNMIAQRGTWQPPNADNPGRPVLVQYGELSRCLAQLAAHAGALGASVHMPRIGTGLAGGDWHRIEPLIEQQLAKNGIDVTVYDLEPWTPTPPQRRTARAQTPPRTGSPASEPDRTASGAHRP
jgi:O-acetyl-ADP-ribose deacetylase (regulator of RNase III)